MRQRTEPADGGAEHGVGIGLVAINIFGFVS
jgi:hypothetical protein